MNWFKSHSSRPSKQAFVDELRAEQLVDDDGVPLVGKSAVRARLDGVDLAGADLRHADLRHASLVRANLSGALLDGADLSWADLSHADLEGADFGKAQAIETLLQHARVADADMSRMGGLTAVALRGATGLKTARLPQGFNASQPHVVGPVIH